MEEIPMMDFAPQPVATSVSVRQFTDGKKAVMMTVAMPTGLTAFYVSADTADEIAGHLKRAAQEARSTIVVPELKVIGNGHDPRQS